MNIFQITYDGSEDVQKGNIKIFIVLYFVQVFLFCAIAPWIFSPSWVRSSDFHSCSEIIGSFVALIGGVSCLMYFWGVKNRFYLIGGLDFFIAGSEDLIHGIVSFQRLFAGSGVKFSRFITATYFVGRNILAISFIVAATLETVMGKIRNARRETLLYSFSMIVFSMAATARAFITPLPKMIYPSQLISRPVDFIPAILFLITFVFVSKRLWHTRGIFSGLLLAGIVFNLSGQVYMSF